jgi:hypothetical protein
MSELLQSGTHPDADQLNAFVEHALPTHEHQATLVHLSVCADCRAVVAFSLPPYEEELPQPEPLRRPWLSGWRLIWPIATAAMLAVLVALSIHIRNIAITPFAPTAANHVPPPPTAQHPETAESRQRNAVASAPVHSGDQPSAAPRIAKPATAPAPSAIPLQGRAVANLLQRSPSATSAAPVAGQQAAGGTFSANGAALAFDQNAAPAHLLQAEPAAGKVVPAPQAAPLPLAINNVAANDSIESQPTAFAVHRMAPLDRAPAILRLHPLPSGLPALSIVTDTRQHQTLAVDIHGALFLTADSGEHWTLVRVPWQGRAVEVDLAYSGNGPAVGISGYLAKAGTSQFAPVAGSTGGPVMMSSGALPSSLGGTVTDASGAIIPGATVIVSASPTQLARIAKTDATGHYLVDGLVPGKYSVEANSPGFTQQQLSGVSVAPGKPALADLTLQVGAAAQTVAVSAAQAQMELSPEGASTKKEVVTAAAPAKSQPVFEITTDLGDHWVSADGVNWQQK